MTVGRLDKVWLISRYRRLLWDPERVGTNPTHFLKSDPDSSIHDSMGEIKPEQRFGIIRTPHHSSDRWRTSVSDTVEG